MSAISSDSLARDWARKLEERERMRSGLSVAAARRRVASRIGVLPGTLENLSRDRLKGVRTWIYQRLQEALVHELQREHRAVAHELETLARLGRHVDLGEVEEVQASLERLKSALFQPVAGDQP